LKRKVEGNYPLDRAYKVFFSEDDNKETWGSGISY
jgi:hypothetical protein